MRVQTAVFRDARSRDVVNALLSIHWPSDIRILDMTWGKGAFWQGTERHVVGADLAPRYGCHMKADAQRLPIRSAAFDVAVFDPPHLFSRGPSPSRQTLHDDYSEVSNYEVLRRLYAGAATEIRRVATRGAIIKFTDMVKFGRLHPSHLIIGCEIAPVLGWPDEIAILDSGTVRPNPSQEGGGQRHLRNNHSYFFLYDWG